MVTIRSQLAEVINEQPEDATYEEIIRECSFHRMVDRGLADARAGRVITNEDMGHRIKGWQK